MSAYEPLRRGGRSAKDAFDSYLSGLRVLSVRDFVISRLAEASTCRIPLISHSCTRDVGCEIYEDDFQLLDELGFGVPASPAGSRDLSRHDGTDRAVRPCRPRAVHSCGTGCGGASERAVVQALFTSSGSNFDDSRTMAFR